MNGELKMENGEWRIRALEQLFNPVVQGKIADF